MGDAEIARWWGVYGASDMGKTISMKVRNDEAAGAGGRWRRWTGYHKTVI